MAGKWFFCSLHKRLIFKVYEIQINLNIYSQCLEGLKPFGKFLFGKH
jgi:hypothetical protein